MAHSRCAVDDELTSPSRKARKRAGSGIAGPAMAKRVRKMTKGEIVALLGVLDREVARRAKTPRKLTLLARATAAGRVSRFEAFGEIADMAGADAFGPARGAA